MVILRVVGVIDDMPHKITACPSTGVLVRDLILSFRHPRAVRTIEPAIAGLEPSLTLENA